MGAKADYLFGILRDLCDTKSKMDDEFEPSDHDLPVHLSVLMNRVGDLSQEVVRCHLNGDKDSKNIREDALRVAAAAVAIVDKIDRGNSELISDPS